MAKLTRTEHHARAMLLGRIYDWRDGTYCHSDGVGDGGVSFDNMINAETLEPIGQSEAMKRSGGLGYKEVPEGVKPWEREDDEPTDA